MTTIPFPDYPIASNRSKKRSPCQKMLIVFDAAALRMFSRLRIIALRWHFQSTIKQIAQNIFLQDMKKDCVPVLKNEQALERWRLLSNAKHKEYMIAAKEISDALGIYIPQHLQTSQDFRKHALKPIVDNRVVQYVGHAINAFGSPSRKPALRAGALTQ